ncbi:MAG: helix-turn-helix domain-containing protein [Prevotella sp.]|nr:helix-turn-helix domain-containing protein [Prevotella sp.]
MQRLLIFLITLFNYMAIAQALDDDVTIMHFSEADGFSQTIVNQAIQDSLGYVWLATWDGLNRYDGYRFENYKMRPGDGSPLRTNRFGTIRQLPDGNIECTTTDSLFFIFDRQTATFRAATGDYRRRPRLQKVDSATATRIGSLPEFAGVYANILLVDRQGGIWVDTHSGLYRVWFAKRPLIPTKFGNQSEEEVRAFHTDRQGRTWVADKNGYVRLISADRSQSCFLTLDGRLTEHPTAFGESVYCIYEDSRARVWLGCKPGGLVRLSPRLYGGYDVKRYRHDPADANSLGSDNIYDLAEDASGHLWIAAYDGGLNMLDGDRFLNSRNQRERWPSAKVRVLHITEDQVLVVGTLQGLFTASIEYPIERMHFHHNHRDAHDASSLGYDWVTDLQPVGHDTLAIATSGGGLCLADSRRLLTDTIRFRTLTTRDGLASDICQSMFYDDGQKVLFVVSQAAISCLSLHDNTVTNLLRGTLGEHFNLLDCKPAKTADGHFLFGTTQGVLDIAPDDMEKSQRCPPIVFDCPNVIRLSPDERRLTIRFAALDFNKRVPITYAYRIDGMGDQWTYITDNSITLPDIPPGTLQLHLRSTNGDGAWADNERILTIHRRAAFHETPFAWMLYGLLLTLLVVAVVKTVLYIRRLRHEIRDIRLTSNQRMEVMAERIRELLSIKEPVKPVETVGDIEDEGDRQFADSVRTFVREHISDATLSVQDIARAVGVSRTVLFARMKSVFDTSPANYVLNQRIAYAKSLLQHPGAYIADVAYRSGFSDPKYFSRCFKKLVGQTPTDYQKCDR